MISRLVRQIPLVSTISLFLAILGITFGLKSHDDVSRRFDAIGQSTDVIADQIEHIEGTLSTRYVANFPKNMDAIIGLVAATSETLRIAADHLAYGLYSAPGKADEYLGAIRALRARPTGKPTVCIWYYDEGEEIDDVTLQFGDLSDTTAFRRQQQTDAYKAFLAHFSGIEQEASIWSTHEDLNDWLLAREDLLRKTLQEVGVQCERTGESMPVYVWIRDRAEAIFSLQSVPGLTAQREVSFTTRDPRLISILVDAVPHLNNEPRPTSTGGSR